MKFGVEIEAPRTAYQRKGMLVYDETGDKLEGFIHYGQADLPELYRYYPRGTVKVICSLKVTPGEWKQAMRNRILNPGDVLA